MNLNFARKLDFGCAVQRFAKYVGFNRQLLGIASVLVMAAAAALKVGTPRLNPGGSRLNDAFHAGPRESRFLLSQLDVDGLAFKNEGDKDAFAGPALVRRKTRQSVATINQLLNLELHE